METTTEPAAQAGRRWGWERLAGVAGLLFVGLVIAAIALASPPEADATDEEIRDYFTDSVNQNKQVIVALLLALAGFFFLWYLAGLRETLRRVTPRPGLLALAATGGVVFVCMLYAGIAVSTVVGATYVFSDTFTMDVQTTRVLLVLGFSFAGFGGVGAAILVGAASTAARGSSVLPSWLVWSGFVLSVLLIVSLPLFGLPLAGLVLWVLATSVVLIRAK